MPVSEAVVSISLFLIGLCGLEHYTRNSRLPYVCWVLLAGIIYGVLDTGLLPQLPPLQELMSPDIVLYVFLPILIFDSSRKLDLDISKEIALPAFLLATAGIILNMVVMAAVIFWAAQKTGASVRWIDALFISGIMSATDPVAVGTVFKVFPIPDKLKMLIEGESLLNDGTTVILFMLLTGSVLNGSEVTFLFALETFTIAIGGAILIGILFGQVGARLLRHWNALDDRFIAPILPVLFIYLAFILAQAAFEISGVVAAMSATITFRSVFGHFRRDELPDKALLDQYRALWDFLADMANVLLFFVLGVEMGSLGTSYAPWVVPVGIVSLIVARSVTVYLFGFIFSFTKMRISMAWQHVLNIGGLRGALCAALVLLIPLQYPLRGTFLYMALSMSLFTLIFNSLAMRYYLRRVRFDTPVETEA